MTVVAALLGYAAFLAVATPRLLDATWLHRSPRLALALWHASAVSTLLAILLATVACFADDGMANGWLAALNGHGGETGLAFAAAPIVVPLILLGRLGLTLQRLSTAKRAGSRRHLDLVSLLGRQDRQLGATVLPTETPAAYCLPGAGRIVITDGAIAILDGAELQAVVAHETAHLTGRHYLLVGWADTLRAAFGVLPLFRRIRQATGDLVELVADDRTVRRGAQTRQGGEDPRRVSAETLASAIAVLGCRPTPTAGLAATGGSILTRVERLLSPPAPLPLVPRIGATGATAALLTLPILLAFAPAALAANLIECPPFLG
ncbi:M56 family metallopeptidase [Kribbella sp. NPDC026611]|uniref:M56 family metallopeptidase n=1 Tax=Kribbella sp. NPDC026611 TaxID=3154911 RepID=UPI0033D607AC